MKVIILGSGVIGVTTAYYLRKKGLDVTVIEAESASGLATSFANGSQLSYSKTHPLSDIEILKRMPRLLFSKNTPIHIHPGIDMQFLRWGMLFLRECLPSRTHKNARQVLEIALKSREAMHQIIIEHNISFDYARRGKMYVFTESSEFEHTVKDADRKASGIKQQVLTASAAAHMEPALEDMQHLIKGAIFSEIDEAGDARKFTQGLAAVCEAMGVTFYYNSKIEDFRVEGGVIKSVTAAGQEFTADRFVVCLGPESPRVMKKIGVSLPVYPMKGYSITIPATSRAPEINITDEEKRVVYSKIGDRLRIAGVAEFAGWDYKINRKIMDGMIDIARERFPRAGDYSQITEWTALRPMTPSTVPIIGRAKKFDNLYLNTGHGMLGWTLACGSAVKLAEQIN